MLYFLLFLVILLMPFSFRIRAKTETDRVIIKVDFMLLDKFGIKIFKTEVTAKKVMQGLFSGKKKRKIPVKTVFDHISLESLEITSSLGTGSAASTAIVCGQIFAFIAPLTAGKENCRISVTPVFDKKQFVFFGECIFSVNLANAIIAFVKIFGGKKNGKTPYRKYYGIDHGKP